MTERSVPAEVYSRISGYFRPVYVNGKSGQWNKGKTEEFKERKFVDVNALQMPDKGNAKRLNAGQ